METAGFQSLITEDAISGRRSIICNHDRLHNDAGYMHVLPARGKIYPSIITRCARLR